MPSPPAATVSGCRRGSARQMLLRWRVAAGVVLSLLLLLIFAAAVLLRVRVAARKKKRGFRYSYNESPTNSPANTRSQVTFSQERRGLSKSVDAKTGGRLLTREDDIELEPADDIIDNLQKDLDAVVLNGSQKDLVAFADQAAESSRRAGLREVGSDQV